MDKEYILMCTLSPIQKEWKPKNGDKVLSNGNIEYVIHNLISRPDCDSDEWSEVSNQLMLDVKWIPTPEDWQEKWFEKFRPRVSVMETFNNFYHAFYAHDYSHNFTMQIMWCLFVHHEVYNLVWDWSNKKWIKDE